MVEDGVEAEQSGSVVAGLLERLCVVEELADGLSHDVQVVQLQKTSVSSSNYAEQQLHAGASFMH